MTRLRFILVASFILVLTGCPSFEGGLPENTISFTFDGVDYQYSASSGSSTHAWGKGSGWEGSPPSAYIITASATEADSLAGKRTIEFSIGSEGDYWIDVYVYDADGTEHYFYLGNASRTLLEHLIANLDIEGEQMWGYFLQRYNDDAGEHTLENISFSVERLPTEFWVD